jgi:hypothetical protein
MKPLRRIVAFLLLALALVAGQQAVALHDIAHVTGDESQHDGSKPGPSKCDKCFACAELSGAVGVAAVSLPPVLAARVLPLASLDLGAPATTRVAFRSRAPPAFSA